MKILVSLSVPAISEQYDVTLPSAVRVKKLIPLMAQAVETLSNQRYVSSGRECLCVLEKNIQLRPNTTLEQYGVKSGDHLVMI